MAASLDDNGGHVRELPEFRWKAARWGAALVVLQAAYFIHLKHPLNDAFLLRLLGLAEYSAPRQLRLTRPQ
jgi:hypothetical protein